MVYEELPPEAVAALKEHQRVIREISEEMERFCRQTAWMDADVGKAIASAWKVIRSKAKPLASRLVWGV